MDTVAPEYFLIASASVLGPASQIATTTPRRVASAVSLQPLPSILSLPGQSHLARFAKMIDHFFG